MNPLGSSSPPGRASGRSSPLAMIHVGKKQLGLDDDSYRGLLERVTGKRSAAALSEAERNAVVDEMRRQGFTPASKPSRKGLDGPYAAKLQALWIAGWNLGVVRDRRDHALIAFVERQTKISHTRFLRFPEDAAKVIEALKGWLARAAAVDWSAPPSHAPDYFADDRFRIVTAQWRRLHAAGETGLNGIMVRVTGKRDFASLDSGEWISLMNALGGRLRAALAGRRP